MTKLKENGQNRVVITALGQFQIIWIWKKAVSAYLLWLSLRIRVAPLAPRDVTVRVILPLLVEVNWKVPAVTNGNIARYTVYAIPLVSTEPIRGKRQASATLPKTVKMVR